MTTPNEGANDTTVFGGEATKIPTEGSFKEVKPSSEGSDLISTLVGEGKKFKTVEDLAKGKAEADAYIEHLKAELNDLRTDLNERLKIEDALKQIKEARNQPAPSEGTPSAINAEDLQSMVKEQMTQIERERTAAANIAEADRLVFEKFNGDKKAANEFVRKKAEELGIGLNFLQSMAAKSPKAVMNFLGLDTATKQTAQLNPQGSVNTTASDYVPNGTRQGTKEYYDNIRRTNPSLYWSSKTQNEIFEAKKKGTY